MLPAVTLTIVLALLAVFQLALIGGAPWGSFAWGGKERVLSRRLRIGSGFSIVIYVLIAAIVLDRAGVIDVLPDVVSTVGIWIVFAYFCLGTVLNAISRSKPERYTMTPVTVVLAVLSLLVALS